MGANMKKLNQNDIDKIRTFVYRNARPIDLAIWKFTFEDGDVNEVVKTLQFYQNQDGGFAGQIESDSWSPKTSPYATLMALQVLDKISYFKTASKDDPIIKGIVHYLESGADMKDYGWMFTIPSNDDYPCAMWWNYNETENKLQAMGLTATIYSFVIRYFEKESSLYNSAIEYINDFLKKIFTTTEFGEMGLTALTALLDEFKTKNIEQILVPDGMKEQCATLINARIERDPAKWNTYTPRPSAFIDGPNSPFYHGNEEIIEKELDYLIETITVQGVWDINWNWITNAEKYKLEFAISENWWKSNKAIEKLEFLRNFGRCEI
jgi:hypothetical protein